MGFLTDLKIRTLSPSTKELMLNDGDGLYLRVRASSKSWLYRYKSGTKQIKISFGTYPAITLAMARQLAREASALRAQGIDPRETRREQQEQAKIAKMNTFELMARAWLESASKDRIWSVGYPRDKEAATVGNGSMTAFRIDEPAKIDRLYALALGLGGTDEGPAPSARVRRNSIFGLRSRPRWQ